MRNFYEEYFKARPIVFAYTPEGSTSVVL